MNKSMWSPEFSALVDHYFRRTLDAAPTTSAEPSEGQVFGEWAYGQGGRAFSGFYGEAPEQKTMIDVDGNEVEIEALGHLNTSADFDHPLNAPLLLRNLTVDGEVWEHVNPMEGSPMRYARLSDEMVGALLEEISA